MHVTTFRKHLAKAGTKDPFGVHHEFNQGLHGQKRDLGLITPGTPLYEEWVGLTTETIRTEYSDRLPTAVVGVADGTTQFAEDNARKLGVLCLKTEKKEGAKPVLTEAAKLLIAEFQPDFVLVLEDLATRGTNSLSVARSLHEAGVEDVRVLNTTQRSETVALLDEHDIPYSSIYTEVLPTFTPEECRTLPEGFCKQEFRLIPYR